VVQAVDAVKVRLRPGQLVILESTTYPGTTEEVVQPALQEGGLKAGVDFHLAFSPERVDPGNEKFSTRSIPKVVGGVNEESTDLAAALYGSIITTVVPVSSTQVAEMVKLLENTFRAVNIGLVNEIALMSHRMNIDVWEVIDAAKTKPFGFQAFYPGPGLGGHCIPIDPFYLTWLARRQGLTTRFIELAGEINTSMPKYVIQKVAEALNEAGKPIKGSKICVLGAAYKKDVDDVRESPALEIMELLQHRGAILSYSDPYIPRLHKMRAYDFSHMSSVKLSEEVLRSHDVALITTDHTNVDYLWIVDHAPLVVDTRNATRNVKQGREKIIRA